MLTQTMYKKDTKGKLRVLSLYVTGDTLYSASGIAGSWPTKTSKVFKTTKSKTGEAKAETAFHKKISDKRKTGWVDTTAEAENPVFIPRPQLLSPYDKHRSKVKYPCIAQPKLDGVRCLWTPDNKFLTRNGKTLVAPHITLEENPGLSYYLDGELYAHGMPLQDIISCTRKVSEETNKISFIIFDSIQKEDSRSYRERLAHILPLVQSADRFSLEIIETKVINSEEELDIYYADCLARGFEGIVVKDWDAKYEWNRRVTHQLKRKPTFTNEFEVVGVGGDTSAIGVELLTFYCKTKDGSQFKVIPAWSHKQREVALNRNKQYVGKQLTVEYKSVSNDGIPLHAVGIAIREDI